MEAKRNNREREEGEDAEECNEREGDGFCCTHQSMEHLKKHGAEAPPVHCWAVWVASQHLWSQVLWSSTKRVHNPPYGDPFFTKPKVSQHHMTLTVQQDVLWFEVSGRETNRTVENWFTSGKKKKKP